MTVKIFFPDRLLSLSFAFFVSPLIFEVDLQVSYSRPLRWFLALHGDTIVPFTYADILR